MLTKWHPFSELHRLSADFDHLFNARGGERSFFPAVDIFEEKEAILLSAELPGMKVEDVKVEVERNTLTLSGERKLSREESDEEGRYRRVERSYGHFTRSFTLPRTVDAEKIEAELKEGILTLRLPKREVPSARQVSVRAA